MLTLREQDTLRFITNNYAKECRAQLLTEIAAELCIRFKGVVHHYVSALVEKGHIIRNAQTRGIKLVNGPDFNELTILGRIAAGKPIEIVEDHQQINFLQLLGGPNRYVL
jgi:repressor LexA